MNGGFHTDKLPKRSTTRYRSGLMIPLPAVDNYDLHIQLAVPDHEQPVPARFSTVRLCIFRDEFVVATRESLDNSDNIEKKLLLLFVTVSGLAFITVLYDLTALGLPLLCMPLLSGPFGRPFVVFVCQVLCLYDVPEFERFLRGFPMTSPATSYLSTSTSYF
ncbi:hypothetical protein BDR07DRAFT_269486 [Suillus spraguei]|nr:hypothetical protein BDR07DRAFT_269486 [Suillus spraguei]